MGDTARLQIRVDSLEAEKARGRLGDLEKQGKRTERATDGLTSGFKKMLGPLAAAVSTTAALKKVLNVAREFDILNAQLVSATGSAEGAAQAFDAIQTFATETPFALQEVTESFTQLVNRGLDPSEESLTNIGNLASAFGRSLGDTTRAIAQATTGEFESLKQFGVVSKKMGDEVEFTFRGMSQTVEFNALAIQEHLQGLAANNFAGAMTERMATLDGAISNLGDEWDKLFLNISQQGVGEVMEFGVRMATEAIADLNDLLASGTIEAHLMNIGNTFSGVGEDFDNVANQIQELFKGIDTTALETSVNIDTSFGHVPDNIRAMVQIMTVELFSLLDKMGAWASEAADTIQYWDGDTFDLEARITAITMARESSIDSILAERDQAVKRYDDEKVKIDETLTQYKQLQAAKAASDTDSLAGFGVGASGDTGLADKEQKEKEAGEKSLERLRQSLLSEEQAIEESYIRRLEIIAANTEMGSQIQTDLITKSMADRAEKIEALDSSTAENSIGAASDAVNNVLAIQKSGAAEGSKLAKTASIAQATMKTYEAATGAYSSLAGIPFVGPALGAAAAGAAIAAGLANVQKIQSAGSFASGGVVGGSSASGDKLTANVNSGEMILNKQQQGQLFNQANGGGGGGGGNIQINNLLYVDQLAEALGSSQEFEEVVMNIINVNQGERE